MLWAKCDQFGSPKIIKKITCFQHYRPHYLPFRSSSQFSFLEDLCVPSDLSISPGMTQKRIPKLIHKLKLLSKSTVNNAKTLPYYLLYYELCCTMLKVLFIFLFLGLFNPFANIGPQPWLSTEFYWLRFFCPLRSHGFSKVSRSPQPRLRFRCVIRHKFTERECLSH